MKMDMSSNSDVNSCGSPDKYHEEELDPRVKIELDRLNKATDEINKLETALEDANNCFRDDLSENSTRLKTLSLKVGSAVEKSRPFFEATAAARKLHLDCQRTAVQYHRANAVHQAARTTISLAEDRFTNHDHEHHREFDPAWQEMLNHATRKVLEAEAGRSASEREHEKRAAAFTEAQQKVSLLSRQLKSSIAKARPYFEQKEQFDAQMSQMSDRVNSLQRAVAAAKVNYSQALKNLERISEEIHLQRKFNSEKREPGVGAEENTYSHTESWSRISPLDHLDDTLNHELDIKLNIEDARLYPLQVSPKKSLAELNEKPLDILEKLTKKLNNESLNIDDSERTDCCLEKDHRLDYMDDCAHEMSNGNESHVNNANSNRNGNMKENDNMEENGNLNESGKLRENGHLEKGIIVDVKKLSSDENLTETRNRKKNDDTTSTLEIKQSVNVFAAENGKLSVIDENSVDN